MKVTRLEFIDSLAQTDDSSDTLAYDLPSLHDKKRGICRVQIKGFVDEDRYCVVLQDDKGNIVDLSLIFEVTAQQIKEIDDLHVWINVECARLPKGSFGCVKVSELQSNMLPKALLPKGKNGGKRGGRKSAAPARGRGARG